MHKYNNQDHAMMSSILTVENILNDNLKNDPWMINIDAEYHEEKKDHTQEPTVPTLAHRSMVE